MKEDTFYCRRRFPPSPRGVFVPRCVWWPAVAADSECQVPPVLVSPTPTATYDTSATISCARKQTHAEHISVLIHMSHLELFQDKVIKL